MSNPPSSPNVIVELPPLTPDDYLDTNPIGIASPEDKTALLYRPGIKPFFRWYDLWVGAYWDKSARHLYICPIPMFGVRFTVPRFASYWRRVQTASLSTRLFVLAGILVFFSVLGGFAGGYYVSETSQRPVHGLASPMTFDAPVPSIKPVATEMIRVSPSASVVEPTPVVSATAEAHTAAESVPMRRRAPIAASAITTSSLPSGSIPSTIEREQPKNPYGVPPEDIAKLYGSRH